MRSKVYLNVPVLTKLRATSASSVYLKGNEYHQPTVLLSVQVAVVALELVIFGTEPQLFYLL